jgi:opacity protein-like surface antigen
MKKILLGAVALAALAAPVVATVATAGPASAAVAVTDGIGHVDKGDVQTTLHWNNGDFDKNVGSLTFDRTMTRTTDNVWSCTGVGEQHSYRVTVMKQPLNKTTLLSTNGKQITGWDLTGAASGPYTVLSDTGVPADVLTCPAGSTLDFTKPWSINQLGVAKYTTYTYGDLAVNGIDLPNTPVVVPAA